MKVFVSDVDDTIYSHRTCVINPRVKDAFGQLIEQGIPVVLASARVLYGLKTVIRQLGLSEKEVYCVAGNGSEIYRDGYLYEAVIPAELVETVYNYALARGFAIGVDQRDHLLINRWNKAFDDDRRHLPIDLYQPADFLGAIRDPVHKISLTGEEEFVRENFARTARELEPLCAISNAGDDYIDIIMRGHDKAFGLGKLLELLKLKEARVYYIGDSYNDIELMKAADVAACVAGAKPECRKLAQVVTASCEAGGAADFIAQLLADKL